MNESGQEQENVESVTIHSPFQQAISQFDNEVFFPDVDIAVPGLNKILHLHRSHLASSMTLNMSFKGQRNEHCRYDGDKRALEWIHKEAENDELYRRVFVKWLRFCYGEDQTFSVDECPVALTVLSELKLSCEEEVKKEIERMISEAAKRNEGCLEEYLKNKDTKQVDELMVELPPKYLDVAKCSEESGEQNEFRVRMRCEKCDKDRLSVDEKCELVKKRKRIEVCLEEMEEQDCESCDGMKKIWMELMKETIKEKEERKKMEEREAVMNRREYLLKKIPGLMNIDGVEWDGSFSEEDLEGMCELLKVNAIPTKSFDISCEKTNIHRLL